jgi:hypothetical protein
MLSIDDALAPGATLRRAADQYVRNMYNYYRYRSPRIPLTPILVVMVTIISAFQVRAV